MDVKSGYIDKNVNNAPDKVDSYEYPCMHEQFRKFTMQFHRYTDDVAVDVSHMAKIPPGIEVAVARNEDNPDDDRYFVYAFNRYWEGSDLNQTMAVAIRDLANDLLEEKEKNTKLASQEYDRKLIASSFSRLAVNGKEFSKFSLSELYRQNYEALPPNYENVETVVELCMDADGMDDEAGREFIEYCQYIGGIIPGIKIRKAMMRDRNGNEDEEPVEVYIADTPCSSYRDTDPINALAHAAHDMIPRYLTMHRTIRELEAEIIRLNGIIDKHPEMCKEE